MLNASLIAGCKVALRASRAVAGRVLLICAILFVVHLAMEFTQPLARLAGFSSGGRGESLESRGASSSRDLSAAGPATFSNHAAASNPLNLVQETARTARRVEWHDRPEPTGWLDNPHYSGSVPKLVATSAVATEESESQHLELAAINYHGISFKTTHGEFLRRFPQARPAGTTADGQAASENEMVSYAIADLDGERDAIWFHFSDDRLLRLGFTYGPERVEELGGPGTLLRQTENWLGPPTQQNGAITRWRFPAINRSATLWTERGAWHLAVTPISVDQR